MEPSTRGGIGVGLGRTSILRERVLGGAVGDAMLARLLVCVPADRHGYISYQ